MNIVTGYKGEGHITSTQIKTENQGGFGVGSYILDVGNQLEATAVSANEIRISDGAVSHQGCIGVIPAGSYDPVSISNGTQGQNRIDLIVVRYTRDSVSGVEDLALAVIEGTPTSGTPTAPDFTAGNILAGDSPVDMPLYLVRLTGITISSIISAATTLRTAAEIDALLGKTSINGIGNGTITGAISAINGKTILASQKVTSFYDSRCENVAAGEETYLLKVGSIHVAVICVKMKKSLTSSQTSIITLPSGFNVPVGYQPWGILYNRTTGKLYQANVSGAGNINIINRGELAIGDNLFGEIVWMA